MREFQLPCWKKMCIDTHNKWGAHKERGSPTLVRTEISGTQQQLCHLQGAVLSSLYTEFLVHRRTARSSRQYFHLAHIGCGFSCNAHVISCGGVPHQHKSEEEKPVLTKSRQLQHHTHMQAWSWRTISSDGHR